MKMKKKKKKKKLQFLDGLSQRFTLPFQCDSAIRVGGGWRDDRWLFSAAFVGASCGASCTTPLSQHADQRPP